MATTEHVRGDKGIDVEAMGHFIECPECQNSYPGIWGVVQEAPDAQTAMTVLGIHVMLRSAGL